MRQKILNSALLMLALRCSEQNNQCERVREFLQTSQACEEVSADEYNHKQFRSQYTQCGMSKKMSETTYCCCGHYRLDGGRGSLDGRIVTDGGADTPLATEEPVITNENKGTTILADELTQQRYLVEINDGSWRITLQNKVTGEYNIILQPDIRFRQSKGNSYSYLEFLSDQDKPRGIVSDTPFYREILPDTEDNLRRYVQDF